MELTLHRDAETKPHVAFGEARLGCQHMGLHHIEPPGVELRVRFNVIPSDGGEPFGAPHFSTTDLDPRTWRAQNLSRAGPSLHLREFAPRDKARVLGKDEAH
jgi:hypothetical protein